MKISEFLLKHLKNKKGNSSIIFLLASIGVIGVTAFVVDAGMLYLEDSKLQNAADSIALAAMQEFADGEHAMLDVAYHYADLNGVDPLGLSITISENRKSITVEAQKTVDLYFAKIFNKTNAVVQARATAKAGVIKAVNGIRPFAIEQQAFEYGRTYTLKKGAGEAYSGNYGALALGGTGASNYKNNLMYGYNSNLEIGDLVRIGEDLETEPGNMAGPTYEGVKYLIDHDSHSHTDLTRLEKNCPRLITLPVIDSFDVQGRSTLKIVGFAKFFLDDVTYEGGKTEIKGKFIKVLEEGEIDDSGYDFGMYGVKLVE